MYLIIYLSETDDKITLEKFNTSEEVNIHIENLNLDDSDFAIIHFNYIIKGFDTKFKRL